MAGIKVSSLTPIVAIDTEAFRLFFPVLVAGMPDPRARCGGHNNHRQESPSSSKGGYVVLFPENAVNLLPADQLCHGLDIFPPSMGLSVFMSIHF
jgi:hypothetical protein